MVDSFEADIFSVSLMSGRMVHLLKQVTNALNISFKTLYHNQFINSVDNTKVQITLLYSPTDTEALFLWKVTCFVNSLF